MLALIRRLFILACAACLALPAAAAPKKAGHGSGRSRVETAAFTSEFGNFEIKAVITDTSNLSTYQDFTVDYTVRWNGKALPREHRGAGTTSGCLYGDKPKMPAAIIQDLKVGSTQVGWKFELLGRCGAGSEIRNHWVVVWPEPSSVAYQAREFMSKLSPIMVPQPAAEALVWSIYQEYGAGNTAQSFFVPTVFKIRAYSAGRPFIENQPFAAAKLPADVTAWPVFEGYTSNAGIVGAGIHSYDAAPIRHVLKSLSAADMEHFKAVGLPSTREDLAKLADALDIVGPILLKFGTQTRNGN